MAMNRSGHRPGGGSASRNVRHVTAPKVEPKPHARNPGKVGQWGQAQGDHVTTLGGGKTSYKGEPDFTRRGYAPPVGPTDNVAACGVGGGRKVYASGSQGQQGDVAGSRRPQGRDILNNE
jgi:hypothetical protein